MLKSLFSSPRASVLEQSLAAASLRHKIISNNIANVNTPNFKKSEVVFESFLQNALNENKLALANTNNKHISLKQSLVSSKPQVSTVTNTTMRTDGNNVDIDVEMAELAKNNIYYNAVAQQLGNYFSGLKSVINEGKR
ncbi:flagellar basal body rod protein FlgB [Dendrosporobacter sp. 1207_IL3150]|uniref:flagellar basal body rod protein FlgB n=1 Tax=Dendrosporobacter sp. 1207_IL3150 TaxID=3084054 RepID=UPI002FD970A4